MEKGAKPNLKQLIHKP